MRFDFTEIAAKAAEKVNYEPIPEGIYTVRIEEITEKPTRAGGAMLVLKERVIDGEFKNRVLFQNVNVLCSSEVAMEIAREMMFKIYVAANVELNADSAKLMNKTITVKVIQDEYNGSIKNVVKNVLVPKKTEKNEVVVGDKAFNVNEMNF